jgi:D-3-phosphoglycerate dehydrogenase/C-terminal binding protein
MAVQFYDPYLPDGADLATGWKRLGSIEELFAGSDAVSMHSPLNDETRRIVNASVLDCMKPGAILVNTSRGGVVDIDAVYEALKSGRLAGAALDVLPTEPPPDHPLLTAYAAREDWIDGRLILTPHAAFYSPPGLEDLRRKAVSTVAAHLRDGSLRNCQNSALLKR